MKITNVEPILVALPYEDGAPKRESAPGHSADNVLALFVKVETDEGITGWGEAFSFATVPVTIPAIADAVGPLAIGQDPTDIEAVAEDLRRRYQNMMRGGPGRFALSAIEIAMWDIKGKVEGKPVWQLLGGTRKETVEAYASMFRYHDPATVKHIAASAYERGYRQIKLHERTVEAVAAAREALGPGVPLMVDVNCAWYPDEAIAMAQKMQPYDIAWLEEPVSPPDDYDGLARVRREGGVPIANGENIGNPYDVKWMAAREAVDIVQPSVVKHGGISDVMRMVEIAESAGMRAVPHCPFVGPGLLATIHIVAAMKTAVPVEHRYCDLGASPLGDAVVATSGRLNVPQGPGLGVEPDLAILERYRVH
jgi:L-alanine-DL-glutamate epimerase-like enolase superfamily enzyme